MTNFGANIKKIRSLKNYTQQHLGDILGLTRAAVSSYEEGRAEPKIETLVRASQIFGVSVDDMINKKLTINELSKFKIPDIELKHPSKPVSGVPVPPNASWHDTRNAIIIDARFDYEQILLAIPDEPDHLKAQLIFTDDTVYVAGEKTITSDSIVAGQYSIPLTAISSISTIIGVYQEWTDTPKKDLQAELKNIKKRLDTLEKKLLD